jgi:hypothetical protein
VLFSEWETFYVIVGSSAGALTGLMFVVIALVADFGGSADQIEAFGTPTVVHPGSALLLSAILTAPWPSLFAARVALCVFGLTGLGYMTIVLRRTRRQRDYTPVFEDWLFHSILPVLSYAAVLTSALLLRPGTRPLLFVIGGAALLLVFIGVHNAWDTVTYIVETRWERRRRRDDAAPSDNQAVHRETS